MADLETAAQTSMVFGALILVVGFLWILWAISPQLLGIFLIAAGGFIIIRLPGISKYEKASMTSAIISIGIIFIIIGMVIVLPPNYYLSAILVIFAVVGTLVIITQK